MDWAGLIASFRAHVNIVSLLTYTCFRAVTTHETFRSFVGSWCHNIRKFSVEIFQNIRNRLQNLSQILSTVTIDIVINSNHVAQNFANYQSKNHQLFQKALGQRKIYTDGPLYGLIRWSQANSGMHCLPGTMLGFSSLNAIEYLSVRRAVCQR